MKNENFEPAKEKAMSVKFSYDCYELNKTIEEEYQTGWTVKQIIYVEHAQEILILFERK